MALFNLGHKLCYLLIQGLLICTCAAGHGYRLEEKVVEIANGKTYRNVEIIRENDYEVSIFHDAGVGRVPMEFLPLNMREYFGYDIIKAEKEKQRVQKERSRLLELTAREKEFHTNQRLAREKEQREKPGAEYREFLNRIIEAKRNDPMLGRMNRLTDSERRALIRCAFIYPQLQDVNSSHFKALRNLVSAKNGTFPGRHAEGRIMGLAEASFKTMSRREQYLKGTPPRGYDTPNPPYPPVVIGRGTQANAEKAMDNMVFYMIFCDIISRSGTRYFQNKEKHLQEQRESGGIIWR